MKSFLVMALDLNKIFRVIFPSAFLFTCEYHLVCGLISDGMDKRDQAQKCSKCKIKMQQKTAVTLSLSL